MHKRKEGLKIEINGGHGCQGPAVWQRTNDDDDIYTGCAKKISP